MRHHLHQWSQPGVNLPPEVNFTYPGGKLSDAEVTTLCFFYSASE